MKEKKLFLLIFLIAVAVLAVQCTDEEFEESNLIEKSGKLMPASKTAGSVQVLWLGGGHKSMEPKLQSVTRQAFFEVNAHEGNPGKLPKGEIIFQVIDEGFVLHREIKANVLDVLVDPEQRKAWIVGSVFYDSKSEGDDHCDHEDGGCSHDDEGDGGCDGGCSHDEGGGCEDGSSHDDGGCEHDDGEECDGGSSHDDEGSCGGGGQGGSGAHISGKNSRVGQIIAVKVHDGGSPGAAYDGISWKWFSTTGAFIPAIDNISQWPHLCKKTIVEGNLVVLAK